MWLPSQLENAKPKQFPTLNNSVSSSHSPIEPTPALHAPNFGIHSQLAAAMASLSCPATPPPRTPTFVSTPTAPATPTGSWRHPDMDKIMRRQAENALTHTSIMNLVLNFLAFVASFVLISVLSKR